MKKLILIPTILTATTPLIGLVGCDKHEYIDVELKNIHYHATESDVMTFEKDKYYRFYWDVHANEAGKSSFGFYDNVYPLHIDKKLNVDVIKVVVDKKVVTYEDTSEDDMWRITFPIDTSCVLLEIFIKVNETKENFVAGIGG